MDFDTSPFRQEYITIDRRLFQKFMASEKEV